MARSRPGHLPRPRLIPAALGLAAVLPGQFVGRPEDQPAIARGVARIVAAARSGGEPVRRLMVPHLVAAAGGLHTGEVGRVLDGLGRAEAAGRGRPWSGLERAAGLAYLHALPEIQGGGPEAGIHLTARLLLVQELPADLAVRFRLADPWTGRILAEEAFPRPVVLQDFLGYQVTLRFPLAGLPPGPYLGELELAAGGGRAAGPREAFHVLEDLGPAVAALGAAYEELRRLPPRSDGKDLLACLEALLGEVDRPLNPSRGEPPLAEVDQGSRLAEARRFARLLREGKDPLAGAVGDLLLGVRSTGGRVSALRVLVPPGLPPPGIRKALLFLPGVAGGEADLAQVYGAGRLPGLCARHGVIAACLRVPYDPGAGDLIGPARKALASLLGVHPRGVTLGGHGRGASQAFYAFLADPGPWAGLALVSGPPADPARTAPCPGGRTLYVEGADDPGRAYLARAEEAARQGLVRFELVPAAEHFLALAEGLEPVLAHAAAAVPPSRGER